MHLRVPGGGPAVGNSGTSTRGVISSNDYLQQRGAGRGASQLSPSVGLDCTTSESCVWKKRWMGLMREMDQVKHQFKESLTQKDTTCSQLTDEKISLQNSNKERQNIIKQQENAMRMLNHRIQSQQAIIEQQSEAIRYFETQYGGSSHDKLSPGADMQRRMPPRLGTNIHSRQSEMIRTQNKPLGSEIGWPSGSKPQSQMTVKSGLAAHSQLMIRKNQSQAITDETTSIRVPILNNNHVVPLDEPSTSPITSTKTDSNKHGGTPTIVIVDERQDPSVSSGPKEERRSDFSLSNAAQVNPSNGEIRPLPAAKTSGEVNLSADGIEISSGKSSEGVAERNNPFEQHLYTHYVDNEESPMQPYPNSRSIAGQPSSSSSVVRQSQTLKNPDPTSMFRDEFVKDTPSFLEIDTDREAVDLEISRNNAKDPDDENTFAIDDGDNDQDNRNSFDSNLIGQRNNAALSRPGQEKKFIARDVAQFAPLPPLVSSASKKASMESNAWVQALGKSQETPPPPGKLSQNGSAVKEIVRPKGTEAAKSFLLKQSETFTNIPSSVTLLQSSQASQQNLNQPRVRVDSDEIELRDSEDGFDENSDDCEFNSLEGNNAQASQSRVPKTQTKFNQNIEQLNQMNRLDVSNQRLIQAMQQKAQAYRVTAITEETSTLQTTQTDFATTMNRETNRVSPRQLEEMQRDFVSEPSENGGVRFSLNREGTEKVGRSMPREPLANESTVNINLEDADEDEDDDMFQRDDEAIVFEYQADATPQHDYRAQEGRPSELAVAENRLDGVRGQFEPLEAVADDEESQVPDGVFDHTLKSESEVQFHARFSTQMSERDNGVFVNRLSSGQHAFALPRSQSQAVTNDLTQAVEHPPVRETRPSTNLVQNARQNVSNQPTQMSNSLSLPQGFELNFGATLSDQQIPEVVDENVDGEESRETLLSQQARVRGTTFAKKGVRESIHQNEMVTNLAAVSENDMTSQVETNLGAFNSRYRAISDQPEATQKSTPKEPNRSLLIPGPPQGDFNNSAASIHTVTRGNDSIAPSGMVGRESALNITGLEQKQSFGTPWKIPDNEASTDGIKQSNLNFFHPVQISDRSQDRYDEYKSVQAVETQDISRLPLRENDTSLNNDDLSRDPCFFDNLEKEALSAREQRKDRDGEPANSLVPQIDRLDSSSAHPGREKATPEPLELALMNRSMNAQYNKMQNSMIVNSRRTSEALLMQPRSSFMINFGNRGKASVAMHASIVHSHKGKAKAQASNFEENRRLSYRSRDGTLKIKNSLASMVRGDNSVAGLSGFNLSPREDKDEDEESAVYLPGPKTEQVRQNMLKKAKNSRQVHHKQTVVTNSAIKDFKEPKNGAPKGNLHTMTADSSQLMGLADEFTKGSGQKKQQPLITNPLNKSVFEPIQSANRYPRKSFVSIGESSPIAEESGNLDWDAVGDSMKFQASPSPNMARRKANCFQSEIKLFGRGGKMAQSGTLHQALDSIENLGLIKNNNSVQVQPKKPARDVQWFAHLMQLKTIQSDFFFEKYLVVGISDATMEEAISKADFRQNLLEPQILFKESQMNRYTSNFQEQRFLIDDDTENMFADFCFPNGVPVVKMCDFVPGLPFEQQSEKTRQNIQEILYEKRNVREDMFCFQLDASDAVELRDGECNYGDCHLVGLVHVFSDFQEVKGSLYLVKKAICLVTTSQANFLLLQELLDQNMQLVRNERQQLFTQRLDTSVYPTEIKACLERKFEDPPDQLRTLLEQVRTFKVTNREEAIDQDGQLFKEVELDGGDLFSYQFPRSMHQAFLEGQRQISLEDMQLDLVEHHWHLPTFFSLFGPKTFFKILTAVMLEHSIIFVHQNYSVISSVIMALKTLLRPIMWCHWLMPVLPRSLLDYILQPLPVLVGISQDDYDVVLKTTTAQERRYKTWVFLDWEIATVVGQDPYYMPFESTAPTDEDLDERSGVRIVWGTMDQEFSQDWRVELLLAWLDDLKTKTARYFDDFEKAARSEDPGAESLHPGVLCSFDLQFEQARQEDQGSTRLDTQNAETDLSLKTRPSLGEMVKSNRKKPFQSVEWTIRDRKTSPSYETGRFHFGTQGTEEEVVLQRDSMPENYDSARLQRMASLNFEKVGQTKSGVALTVAQMSHTVDKQEGLAGYIEEQMAVDRSQYMPIVLIGSQKMRDCIEEICMLLAKTLKEKIIDLVPELCKLCNITEEDQVIDSMLIADKIGQLKRSSQDEVFLEKFAYTQMFNFLVQNYVAAVSQKRQLEQSEAGDKELAVLSRQSDHVLMLNYFNSSQVDIYNSYDALRFKSSPRGHANTLGASEQRPDQLYMSQARSELVLSHNHSDQAHQNQHQHRPSNGLQTSEGVVIGGAHPTLSMILESNKSSSDYQKPQSASSTQP